MITRGNPAIATFACLAVLLAGTARARAKSPDLFSRLLAIESACGDACGRPEPTSKAEQEIAGAVAELRADRGVSAGGMPAVEALRRQVYVNLGIRPSNDLTDPGKLLLTRVLSRREGYCVGIAALYLVLAERLGLPVHAVATPSHVFLRYDDGATRINIETLQGGAGIPDEQYIREQRIPEEAIRKGIFMRNLTMDEFLAQVHNNLGVISSKRHDYPDAARQYSRAIALHPRMPAARYNLGNDLLAQGEFRKSARTFSGALRLHPTDVWALNNRGLAYLKMDKRGKARADFEEALRIDPEFEPARRNAERLRESS